MKQIAIAILFIVIFTASVFAGSLTTFEITSGATKASESTFDDIRTIVGAAEKNTEITIYIYQPTESEPIEMEQYQLTVGASGMFTQDIPLALGENIVKITAVKGSRRAETLSIIRRKDKEIKLELEQTIAFPGKKSF